MGEKRQAYAGKLKEKIDRMNSEIDKLEAKAAKAKTDIKGKFSKHVERLRSEAEGLDERIAKVRKAGEEGLSDLKAGTEKAFEALKGSIRAAKDRFKAKP